MKELSDLEYRAFLAAKSKHSSDLLPDIRALWKVLTQERAESLSDYFRKPALRRAYLGYYMPLYTIKIASLLQTLRLPYKNPKVLDLGAGPLSGIWGAYLAFDGLSQSVAVDREIGPMRAGLEFFEELLKKKLDVKLCRANLKGPPQFWRPEFKPDIIIMAHVLNEFGSGMRHMEAKQLLISQAMNLLDKNGILVMVEPASKISSRDVMGLRDWIYAYTQVKIIAPCPEVKSCPLLLSRYNWCHAEFPHQRPQELDFIDRKIGFDREFLKCSYLVLAKPESGYQHQDFRIVSGLMNSEGVLRRYACTSKGFLTLSQSMRDRTQILVNMTRGEAVSPELWPKNLVKIIKES